MAEVELSQLECKRCGHRWIPRMKHPKTCPECKNLMSWARGRGKGWRKGIKSVK